MNATDILDEQIRALRSEAGQFGDTEMFHLCTAALAGDESARQECADAIQGDNLNIHCLDTDGIGVRDENGGIWWASDEAMAEILAAADPEAAAIAMATNQPMRGDWLQD